jgi:hypothetical protein
VVSVSVNPGGVKPRWGKIRAKFSKALCPGTRWLTASLGIILFRPAELNAMALAGRKTFLLPSLMSLPHYADYISGIGKSIRLFLSWGPI